MERIPYWFLYELVSEICDVLYSDYPRRSWLSTFQVSVEEFLQLCQTIFPDQFVPKFNFLLHAARNIAKYGPLKRQMNLRYEAKHYLLKQIASRCNNFINLPYTISRRMQLRQCYEMMDGPVFNSNRNSGRFQKRKKTTFQQAIQSALLDDSMFIYNEWIDCVKWTTTGDVRYNIGEFVVWHLVGGEEIPLFGEVRYIIHIDDTWRFEINPSSVFVVMGNNEFIIHKVLDCYRINNSYLIRLPYRLTRIE